MVHPSYVEISKGNLLHNISAFKNLLGKNQKIVAVVKANAYGHGLKEIISSAEDSMDYFQVDDLDELREARKYTKKPITVTSYRKVP